MKLYGCTDHDGHWPVGVSSVVIAHDENEARQLLDAELAKHGLNGFDNKPYTLEKIPQTKPVAVILQDGEY